MAQTGPPNQASTPPQNDIKQMQPPQPGQIPMFTMSQVRPAQQGYFRTPPPPNQGGPRMPNHHRQTMASTVATNQPIYSQMAIYPPLGSHTIQYPMQTVTFNAARPPQQYFTAQATYAPAIIPGQYMHGGFPAQSQQPQQYFYQNTTPMPMAGRQTGPPPQVPTAQQTGAQPTQPLTMQPIPQTNKKKLRTNAIPIINPTSGKEIFEEDDNLPPSGESSARETPQPSAATNMQQLISADFAARVAIRASEDKDPVDAEPPAVHSHNFVAPSQHINTNAPPHMHGHGHAPHGHGHVGPQKENDIHHKMVDSSLVQNSKLQVL